MNSILFVFKNIGHKKSLLYWDLIFKNTSDKFALQQVIIIKSIADNEFRESSSIKVSQSTSVAKNYLELIKAIILVKYSHIIVNEFNLGLLCALIFRPFFNYKLICLVENHPKFLLNYYKTDRLRGIHHAYRKVVSVMGIKFIANTTQAEKYLIEDLGVNETNISQKCYLSSVCFQATQPKSLTANEKIFFIFVGRLVPGKGLFELVEAISLLPETVLKAINIKIIGDGISRVRLEKTVSDYGLSKCFEFLGQIPFEELSIHYQSAHVTLFPSLGDYRALFNFEGLAAGCCIIGSMYDGAIDEVVTENGNGFIVDPHNPKTISNSIIKIHSDRSIFHKYSSSSLKMAQKYSIDSVASNLVTAIKNF